MHMALVWCRTIIHKTKSLFEAIFGSIAETFVWAQSRYAVSMCEQAIDLLVDQAMGILKNFALYTRSSTQSQS